MGSAGTGGNRRLPCDRWRDDVAGVAMWSGFGRACSAPYVDSAAPCGAEVVNMADHSRYCGPRFVQLDDDSKVWVAYQRAQLKNEKLWAAVVTDRPESPSD